jgi:hypothetical protein
VRNSATEVLDARANLGQNPRIPRPLKAPSQIPWLIEIAGKLGVGIPPGSPATDILLTALTSGENEERMAALSYLKQNPNDGVVKQIYNIMYADNPEAREAAFLTLWEIGASGYKLPNPTQYGFS